MELKHAVVTGGTRGIGLACVKLLIARGYAVTATYSQDEEGAGRAREMCPAATFLRADVRDEEGIKALFSRLPSLDVLICNAGVESFMQVQDVSSEEYARVTDVNQKGVFLCCKHAVKSLLQSHGAIVNVASVWGETGGSCESVYSASKGAVIAFSKALAKELAPSGVRVNVLSPGVVDTAMNARLSEEERKALLEEIPLGRMGRAEEIAEAALFLAEHEYITGQVLGVNGGFYI